MLTENEIKEIHEEYSSLTRKIWDLEMKQVEIDRIIGDSFKEKVASRFVPLEYGDRIRVTEKTYRGKDLDDYITEHEGFFGSWQLEDAHQYTEDDGVGRVRLRLYKPMKDGTMSCRSEEFFACKIINIEKI